MSYHSFISIHGSSTARWNSITRGSSSDPGAGTGAVAPSSRALAYVSRFEAGTRPAKTRRCMGADLNPPVPAKVVANMGRSSSSATSAGPAAEAHPSLPSARLTHPHSPISAPEAPTVTRRRTKATTSPFARSTVCSGSPGTRQASDALTK